MTSCPCFRYANSEACSDNAELNASCEGKRVNRASVPLSATQIRLKKLKCWPLLLQLHYS